MAGLRADAYDFHVRANPEQARLPGGDSRLTSTVSPKLAAAYTPPDTVELYANWGRGFHSNDARGVVNEHDAGSRPRQRQRRRRRRALSSVASFTITATYWWLDLDSELNFVGDSNSVEPKTGAKRRGYELVAFWKPVPWLGLDAVYTHSRARYKAAQEDPDFDAGDPQLSLLTGRFVEGGVESAGEFGTSAVKGRWEAQHPPSLSGTLPPGAQRHPARRFRIDGELPAGVQDPATSRSTASC